MDKRFVSNPSCWLECKVYKGKKKKVKRRDLCDFSFLKRSQLPASQYLYHLVTLCHWRSVCVFLQNKLINHGLNFFLRAKRMVEAFCCLLTAEVTDWWRISWSAPAVVRPLWTCSLLLCSLPSLISNCLSPLF